MVAAALTRDTQKGKEMQSKAKNVGKGCIRYSKPEKIDFNIVKQLLSESHQSDSEIC